MPKTELKIQQDHWNDIINFALFFKGEKTGYSIATPVTLEKHEPCTPITPTFSLTQEETQALFNRLWEVGFRPKDGTGNSGHVAAIQYHLEDMRKLVFNNKPTM